MRFVASSQNSEVQDRREHRIAMRHYKQVLNCTVKDRVTLRRPTKTGSYCSLTLVNLSLLTDRKLIGF